MHQSCPEPNEQFEMNKRNKEESNKDEGQSCTEPDEHFGMNKRNKVETNKDKGPVRIEKLRRQSIGYSVLKILAALCPIVFLVLVGFIGTMNGKKAFYPLYDMPAASHEGRLLNVIKLVPTVFPMVFSILVAGTLRSVSLYLSGRGTTLGQLEQLIGSSTVGGSIITHARLRKLDVVGVLVVLLWALSPIGGQSALRMFSIRTDFYLSETQTLWYRSSDSPLSLNTDAIKGMISGLYMSALNSRYTLYRAGGHSIATTFREDSAEDIFGNVRIPTIEKLVLNAGHSENYAGWMDVIEGGHLGYSGLLGVPASTQLWPLISQSGTYEFNMETHYFVFKCDIDPPGYQETLLKYKDLGPPGIPFYFTTVSTDRDEIRDDYDATPRIIRFASLSEPTSEKPVNMTWSCRVTTSHVETHNKCEDLNCRVSKIRRSTLTHTSSNWTRLDQHYGDQVLGYFSTMFVNETTYGLSSRFGKEQTYVPYDINNATWDSYLWKSDPETISYELSLLFNTYWSCLMSAAITISRMNHWRLSTLDPPPDAVTMQTPELPLSVKNNESYIPGKGGFPINKMAPFLARKVEVSVVHRQQSFQINWIYFTLYVTSAAVLLIVSCAGAVIQHFVLVPDILGYVSSFTRDNPYADTMPGAAALDGLDRALQLKDQRVKIADVRPGEDVGHISFISSAWVEGSTKLERGRSYL